MKLSAKVDKVTQRSEILIRFYQGQNIDFRIRSGIFISPKHFRYFINRAATHKLGISVPDKILSVCKDEAQAKGFVIRTSGEIIIADRLKTPEVRYDMEQLKKMDALKLKIMETFTSMPNEDVCSKWLESIVAKFNHPESTISISRAEARKKMSIYELAEDYLRKKSFSYDHTKAFKVLIRDLARYEAFVNKILHQNFKWDINKMTRADIEDFEDYLRHEKQLAEKYQKQFDLILEKYPTEITIKHKVIKLQDRGENTIVKLKKKFKAFMQWLYETDKTKNRPFDGIKIGSEKYGVPYYLTKDERNLVANADLNQMWMTLDDNNKKEIPLSSIESLKIQRDIFTFQCLVGCRVSDLSRLTSLNITNDILEYIPSKTENEDLPVKPRIPLNDCAKYLVKRYDGIDKKGRLFPFISSQKYNDAIKKILLICNITRMVQVRNPTTGDTEIKRICDVASSHMARRTFVGAAYKAVKDPNIVGKMSGHVEGSRAFTRYREIDDEILKETIKEIYEDGKFKKTQQKTMLSQYTYKCKWIPWNRMQIYF